MGIESKVKIVMDSVELRSIKFQFINMQRHFAQQNYHCSRSMLLKIKK